MPCPYSGYLPYLLCHIPTVVTSLTSCAMSLCTVVTSLTSCANCPIPTVVTSLTSCAMSLQWLPPLPPVPCPFSGYLPYLCHVPTVVTSLTSCAMSLQWLPPLPPVPCPYSGYLPYLLCHVPPVVTSLTSCAMSLQWLPPLPPVPCPFSGYPFTCQLPCSLSSRGCSRYSTQLPHKLNECDEEGNIPLNLALLHRHEGIANTLVSNKCSLDVQDREGNSLLHLAVMRGDSFAASFLIKHGASTLLARRVTQETVLHLVASYAPHKVRWVCGIG